MLVNVTQFLVGPPPSYHDVLLLFCWTWGKKAGPEVLCLHVALRNCSKVV